MKTKIALSLVGALIVGAYALNFADAMRIRKTLKKGDLRKIAEDSIQEARKS